MNVNLNRPNELKIKALAYYQIIGGVVGLGLTIMMFIKPASTNKLLMPILTIFAGLFCFSILCILFAQFVRLDFKDEIR